MVIVIVIAIAIAIVIAIASVIQSLRAFRRARDSGARSSRG